VVPSTLVPSTLVRLGVNWEPFGSGTKEDQPMRLSDVSYKRYQHDQLWEPLPRPVDRRMADETKPRTGWVKEDTCPSGY